MAPTSLLRPSAVAAAGLVGGFVVARRTGRRDVGGALFAAAGAWCAARWRRTVGAGRTTALVGLYAGAMGGSHPLAKRIGPWPSVAAVTGAVVAASELAGRPRAGAAA